MTGREIKDELVKIGLKLNDDAGYITAIEFAESRGYNPSSMRMMLKREQITGAVKVGDKWMIPEDADILVRQNAKKNKIKMSQM